MPLGIPKMCPLLTRILYVLAILVAHSATAFADTMHDLQRASALYRDGDASGARAILGPIYSRLVGEDRMETPEGICALRLHLTFNEKNAAVLQKAPKLIARAERLLGKDDEESYRARMLLAAVLKDTDQPAEAKEAWLEIGKDITAGRCPSKQRLLADATKGLGRAMLEPQEVRASFDGDGEKEIEPQIKFSEVWTSKTLEGVKLIRRAAELHRQVGGPADPEAFAVDALLAGMKDDAQKFAWKARLESTARIKRTVQEQHQTAAHQRLSEWIAAHPPATVFLCTGHEAEAYHTADCGTLENCETIAVPVPEAVSRYGRRSCLLCDPPSPPYPPDSVRFYAFDGRMWDASRTFPK